MKEFAEWFYKSKTWQHCRREYAKSVRGLCERHLAKGEITPGVIVHHKTGLTPKNIHDPSVTLNWDNLELLCRDCHAQAHGQPRRYRVDAYGGVTIRDLAEDSR